jgi:predicted nucleic acid-binding protein
MSAMPIWLEVRSVSKAISTTELDYLGAGEREAILLAEETHADWLIIDEYAGRQEAARRHLPVMGTLRVLDEASARGLINLSDVIARLRQTTFYLSDDLIQWLLDREAKRRKGA